MAINNLFLGTAGGSVGDVTLMHRNGVQVSRVRVRNVANPKSEGQAQQRSVLAPVAKFYSPLASCLETSWEGKSRSDSYSAYMRRNINLGKANSWLRPKGEGFFPLPYQVSQGTLPVLAQEIFSSASFANFVVNILSMDDYATWGEMSANIIQTYDISDGDQLTFIFVTQDTTQGAASYIPTYSRVYLDSASSAPVDSVLPSSMEINWSPGKRAFVGTNMVAACCILSRWENGKWRRSTQYMCVLDEFMARVISEAQSSRESYQAGVAVSPISPVYLNGSSDEWEPVFTDISTIQYGETTRSLVVGQAINLPVGTNLPLTLQFQVSNLERLGYSIGLFDSDSGFVNATSAEGNPVEIAYNPGVSSRQTIRVSSYSADTATKLFVVLTKGQQVLKRLILINFVN